MIFTLDTNVVIRVLNGDLALTARIDSRDRANFGLSSIVMHELMFGAVKSQRPERNVGFIERLDFPILDFDNTDARMAGRVGAVLAARGTPIGPYDVLIAGQALARDLILITHNIREFARVKGLRVENWQT